MEVNELINRLIDELNGSIFVLLGILYLAFKGVNTVSTWVERNKNMKDSQDRINDENKIIFDKIESKLDILPALKERVDIVYRNTVKDPLLKSHSPLSLTDKGKKLANELDAEKILDKYFVFLLDQLGDYRNLNAYDIQKKSMNLMKIKFKDMIDNDILDKLKTKAYEEGILLDDIMSIFGVLLRDRILIKANLSIEDIEKSK